MHHILPPSSDGRTFIADGCTFIADGRTFIADGGRIPHAACNNPTHCLRESDAALQKKDYVLFT